MHSPLCPISSERRACRPAACLLLPISLLSLCYIETLCRRQVAVCPLSFAGVVQSPRASAYEETDYSLTYNYCKISLLMENSSLSAKLSLVESIGRGRVRATTSPSTATPPCSPFAPRPLPRPPSSPSLPELHSSGVRRRSCSSSTAAATSTRPPCRPSPRPSPSAARSARPSEPPDSAQLNYWVVQVAGLVTGTAEAVKAVADKAKRSATRLDHTETLVH